MPTGKPTNAEFPTAASTPPVSIMTPEPGPAATPNRPPLRPAPPPPPVGDPGAAPAHGGGQEAAGCTEARAGAAAAPVQLAPAASAPPPLRHLRHERMMASKIRRWIAKPSIMPLHLIKLAVGCESVKELKGWVAERMATAKKKGLPLHHIHITRMTPKRDEELLAGGSLYWVIRGEIAAREKIIAIEPFRDSDGIGRCRLVMQPKVIAVSPRPMRAFQGWRYFDRGRSAARPRPGRRRERRGDARADAPRTARSRAALARSRAG